MQPRSGGGGAGAWGAHPGPPTVSGKLSNPYPDMNRVKRAQQAMLHLAVIEALDPPGKDELRAFRCAGVPLS